MMSAEQNLYENVPKSVNIIFKNQSMSQIT